MFLQTIITVGLHYHIVQNYCCINGVFMNSVNQSAMCLTNYIGICTV